MNRLRSLLLLLWMVIALSLALPNGVLVVAQDAPQIDPALDAQMDNLEAATIELRELDGEPVERAFPTRDETILYLSDQLDAQLPLDEAQRQQRFYVAFDLMDPNIDLRRVYLDLLASQVAGFYDSDTRVMHVVPTAGVINDSLPLLEQIVYVHEYTHALQDQHFGLDALLEAEEGTDEPDRLLAVLSLIEGDATAVMTLFTQNFAAQNPLAALSLLGQGLQAGMLALPPDTPPILMNELSFPYEGGMEFVIDVYDEGGWDGVNAAYANPPVSSEQILHPDRYLEGDTPVGVTLAGDASALGEGWTRIFDTTLGEWYLREHLRTQLPATTATTAAAGWGGDRFHIYMEDATGALAVVQRLAWDTPEDAAEFADAYMAFGTARYGDAAPDTNGCWANDADALCLSAVDDGGDTLIARAPTLAQAQTLLAAQR